MMSLWTLSSVFYLVNLLVAAEEEVGSPLRVAQCRAKCVYTFGRATGGFESCVSENDCLMCWERCQQLESNFVVWGVICSKTALCGSGCQLACQFHREGSAQRAPVLVTQGQQVISRSGLQVSWPSPGGLGSPFVYVVMSQSGGQWRQLLQTMDLTARVPDTSLRVLVVAREGLVTIYRPRGSALPAAEDVLRQVSQDALRTLRLPAPHINTQVFAEPSQDPLDMLKDIDGRWNLRQLSLIHQKVLVIAEVAWNPQTTSSVAPVYLVTWEVDGGGLRGNLFTDSTAVTLSLWPDTVYHIQVELVRHDWKHGGQSEQLVLDTHTRGASDSLVHQVSVHPSTVVHPHIAVIAGVAASLATFLLVLGIFTWRWGGWTPRTKTVQDFNQPSHIFKVYPPAVRLGMNASPAPLEAIPSVCGSS
ncbi:uncharacterized protein LOC128987837 [Macrosteles quadrilineatus]|uniref:uncharacterized protein LOC128987837 n=1 Tax=Macrosteles quadrilineatus TaxID=74068 RepID=UPI0023E23128|nr:uncharacterized protein LOC128987837 [Macrosteles quadrilineatus]